MPENLLKNLPQELGCADEESDGVNSAEGNVSSAGRPELTRRRLILASKPSERFQDMAALSVEDPLTYKEALSSPEKEGER